jgi:G3E family GTPase
VDQKLDDINQPPVLAAAGDGDDDDEAPDLIALDDEDSNKLNEAQNDNKATTSTLPPCPVTILSGFLGSGKTTLIQYILKSPDHGKRIAVIENEFGEGLAVESLIARDGVDPQLNSLQDLIELPNGCICCTVKDSLVTTLEALLEKRHDLDYILIEASGMANPGPIASVFWLDDALDSRIKLDGIVTLVDGVHILEQLESTEEAAQQIAYADRIILNKLDLLEQDHDAKSGSSMSAKPKATTAQVEIKIRELHPTAPILRTSFSKIPDLDWILNADCFGGADRLEELETIWGNAMEIDNEVSQSKGHNHSHHHDHEHNDDCKECHEVLNQHRHTASISTVAFRHQGSVNLAKLNTWLAEILWPNQDQTDEVLTAMLHNSDATEDKPRENNSSTTQIFRIKGIVSAHFRDEDQDDPRLREAYLMEESGLDRRRFILQAVHDLWECYPASDESLFDPDEERVGKVVIIGKFLNEQGLKAGFESCFV